MGLTKMGAPTETKVSRGPVSAENLLESQENLD